MGTYKSSFITSFLLIILIDHYVFADMVETCEKLLSKEYNFVNADNGGLINFINAFKYLSKKQINIKYGKPTDTKVNDIDEPERKLTEALMKSYFEDLFVNHGIDVSARKTPHVWCKEIVFGPGGIMYDIRDHLLLQKLSQDSPYTYCLNSTTKMLKNMIDWDFTFFIFQRMYEDWTLESTSEVEYENYTYGRQYFGHYLEVFNEPDENGISVNNTVIMGRRLSGPSRSRDAQSSPLSTQHNSSLTNDRNGVSQHDELIHFVGDSWNVIYQEYQNGSQGNNGRFHIQFYEDGHSDKLKGFKPFDLEAWWGKQTIQRYQQRS